MITGRQKNLTSVGEHRMNANHLRTYMKDHYAGSVAALQLLDHLVSSNSGKPEESLFIALRREVGEDQKTLQKMLHDLDATEGLMRNTVAFVGEKLSRIKLLLEDPSGSQLALLEKLEALALGIEGKRALWHALEAVAADAPTLRKVDFAQLNQRAETQRKRVEALRIEAAREAFTL
jgi:hypothetical protein